MFTLSSIVFALVMGLLMSLTISLVTTFTRIGIADSFFLEWLAVWLVAYPVAIFCIVIYRPFASRITSKLTEKKPK